MRQSPQEEVQPKAGIISTLSTGFDLTTRHIWIVLLPLLLDVFYWIGPRLAIDNLIDDSVAILQDEPAFADLADQMQQIGSQFNLFTSLSLPIIGIPALMGGTAPDKTPVSPGVVQIDDPVAWLLLFLGLSLIGLGLTSVYFLLISFILQDRLASTDSTPFKILKRVPQTILRLIGLGIIFFWGEHVKKALFS